jgi:hypothetical protein
MILQDWRSINDNRIKAGAMSNSQSGRELNSKPREPRLSPELNEILHMLDALESQFSTPHLKTAAQR